MPNIKPVTDLRNYTEVLREVSMDSPVFLTRNGRGRSAMLDIRDYERLQAEIALASELNEGRKSGEENGWLSAGDVRSHFRDKGNG